MTTIITPLPTSLKKQTARDVTTDTLQRISKEAPIHTTAGGAMNYLMSEPRGTSAAASTTCAIYSRDRLDTAAADHSSMYFIYKQYLVPGLTKQKIISKNKK